MTKSGVPSREAPAAARRRGRRYRITASAILLLGLAGAGVVYWLGSRGRVDSIDPAMVGFNRSEERQMGILYGKQGQIIEDLNRALKEPGTQAMLVVAAAAVVASAFFHFARILDAEAREAEDASHLPAARGSD